MSHKGHVLIIDDEPSALKVLSSILSEERYDVMEAKDVDSAIELLCRENFDAVITDIVMPGKDGGQLFEHARTFNPDLPVIFLTAFGNVDSAVSLMENGAFYYFIKPPDYNKLKQVLDKAVERNRGLKQAKPECGSRQRTAQIIGKTSRMTDILTTINSIKNSGSSVLLTGETGTGKELVASFIHHTSDRREKPFVAVNCAAIPRDLMESELFGYEKGSFTGAVSRRIGKFEEAMDGTLFLDEIGELELPLQAKLLRALQERVIERIGSNTSLDINFRLVSSTNRDLARAVSEGRFRSDLYYRINVLQIDIPPLRERKEDIPLIASSFMNEFCLRERKVCTMDEQTIQALQNYSWPGNVRQLRNVIERAVVLTKDKKLSVDALPSDVVPRQPAAETGPAGVKSLKEMELNAMKEALSASNGNKSNAAKQLGISRKTFYKKLRDFGLQA